LGTSQTVQEAVERFKDGQLAQVGAPASVGHHRR
jgi:hypothetical protein